MSEPNYLSDHEAILRLARRFPKRYLLLGSGPRLQYADPERAIAETLALLRGADTERLLLIFGGDSADAARPDLGHLMQRVKATLGERAELLSLQSWSEPCPFAEHIFIYPREFSDGAAPRELWGGTVDGAPVAATRYYLSPELQELLSAVLCIGGGEIAKQELRYAIEQGRVRHHYLSAAARYPRGGDPYGPAHAWYVTRRSERD